MHENRESSWTSWLPKQDRSAKAINRTADTNVQEQSDCVVVPLTLTAPGWIHQVTPTLQRGIISAVLPFTCTTPHAYAINVMVQGGASGSPVFLSESGEVIGVLYAGLNDPRVTLLTPDLYTVPTNIRYVVPSH